MFWKNNKIKITFNKENFFIRHFGKLVSVGVILAVFFIGAYVGGRVEVGKSKQIELQRLVNKDAKPDFAISKDIDFAMFWQVWEKVKSDYVYQPVDEMKMFYGALSGMVGGLGDPYSVFFEPKVAAQFAEELAGQFEGIGAELAVKNEKIIIVAPLLDSPAEKVGLKPGDEIVAIDDTSTQGMALDIAVKMIRGKGGTKVKLTIAREKEFDAKDFIITRDKIVIRSVQWRMLDDNIAYVQLFQFGDDTWKDFDKITRQIILKNPKGIILDMRNNPGGYLDAAIKIAGEWLPTEVVVSEKSRGETQPFKANGKGRFKDIPTVVLINKGSASGSEIVAGALKDYNKAILVGEKSFGKGSVQDYHEYPGGGALKLTIALWLTPNGSSINGQGIEPNVTTPFTAEEAKAGKDPQLDRAIELLKK
jgi:carboxyl-terminal processing protease